MKKERLEYHIMIPYHIKWCVTFVSCMTINIVFYDTNIWYYALGMYYHRLVLYAWYYHMILPITTSLIGQWCNSSGPRWDSYWEHHLPWEVTNDSRDSRLWIIVTTNCVTLRLVAWLDVVLFYQIRRNMQTRNKMSNFNRQGNMCCHNPNT